jgi:hypothetical protein
MSGQLDAGRGWHYADGYLINEFLGRLGHTPAWIVEIEGRTFELPRPQRLRQRVAAWWRPPRLIRRNKRRLAFAWPLAWPPPDAAERQRMVAGALARARELGPPTSDGCGVCQRRWEGGPTMVRGRARHLCPECAEEIRAEQETRPPGPLATWLWCVTAGVSGLLLQLLFHQNWTWTVIPLAVVAGWLMGTANGPNFERRPVLAPTLTVALLILLQVGGWTVVTGTQLGTTHSGELGAIFLLTLYSWPPAVLAAMAAGSIGLAMAMIEKRLERL